MRTLCTLALSVLLAGFCLTGCAAEDENILGGESVELDTPYTHSISFPEDVLMSYDVEGDQTTGLVIAKPRCTGQIECCSDSTCTAVLCKKDDDNNCSATCPDGLTRNPDGPQCGFSGVDPIEPAPVDP